MISYSVLIGIKVAKNDVINNFELHDQISRIHSFLKTLKFAKFSDFAGKIVSW